MGSSSHVDIRNPQALRLSARSLRDGALVERISAFHQANYGVYGVRKMGHSLRRKRIDNSYEHTTRLMCLAGVFGKGAAPITTRTHQRADLRPHLVEREFTVQFSSKLWVG
ncbi:IS3 family transposase [Corynebacterium pseudodiphtheriticum]|uniref:IS3 family transposase n=1 Tax=Corynebacterium pseudodiphtheriticum TaxID=37637 RepID=UPI0033068B39